MALNQFCRDTNTESSERRSMRNMSLGKTELSCSNFQANVFDKSRCQNCFKFRELHVTTLEQLEQAKPIYASWLCLAPEGTDFENPMHRSRKWQRRFFVLYEHGNLQFALDESPSTIPQGSVNLNLCTNVIDAEGKTGQKNALCIITPHQEIFIRGDSREIINGWCEKLLLFKQTNEQKQRKKRSRLSVPSQEDVCMITADAPDTLMVECNGQCRTGEVEAPKDINNAASDFQGKVKSEDLHRPTSSADIQGLERRLCLQLPSPEPWRADDLCLADLPLSSSSSLLDGQVEDAERCANKHQFSSLMQAVEKDQEKHPVGKPDDEDPRFTKSSMTDCLSSEKLYPMFELCNTKGRERSHSYCVQKQHSELLEALQRNVSPHRRSRSQEVKTSESVMTPDLLDFKKGWLFRLDEQEKWRKHWFVLSAYSLRYYFDSEADEASRLLGEIDLTSCYKVTKIQVQRNYGFQLCTRKGDITLAAMTAGIRQNWITALKKNMQNHNVPDVTSLSDNCLPKVEPLSRPDVTHDSSSLSGPVNKKLCLRQRFDRNRRRPISHMVAHKVSRKNELVDQIEERKIRRRGREERRQRYAVMMSSSICPAEERKSCALNHQQQDTLSEIEEYWLQVEKMAIRMEKRVPLHPVCQSERASEMEKLLEHYQSRKPTYDHGVQCELQKIVPNKQNPPLTDKYQETKELLQLQNLRRPKINDQHDLYWLSQFSSEFTNEPMDVTSCRTSGDGKDDQHWATVDVSGERTALVVKEQSGTLFFQETHYLTKHNEALNQRNQELMNQLAEADREIDRLKAELCLQANDHRSKLESVVECLEMELARNCLQLKDAQTQVTEMEDNLDDTPRPLQLMEATLRDQYFITGTATSSELINRLHRCVQVLEAKLPELESQAWFLGPAYWDLQFQDAQLPKSAQNKERLTEACDKIRMFKRQSEELNSIEDKQHQKELDSTDERKNTLEEKFKKKSEVFSTLLEVSSHLLSHDMPESASEHEPAQVNLRVVKKLQLEKDIWECLVNILKDPSLQEGAGCLLQCAEMKLEELTFYLSVFCNSTDTSSGDSEPHDSTCKCLQNLDDGTHNEKTSQNDWKMNSNQKLKNVLRGLKKQVEERLLLFNHIALKINSSTTNEMDSMVNNQYDTWRETSDFHSIASAAMDLLIACVFDTVGTDQSSLPITFPVYKDSKSVSIQTEIQDLMLEENKMTELYERVDRETISPLKSRIKELENLLRESAETIAFLKQEHKQDKERIKTKITAAYEESFTLLKESHKKTTDDYLLKHQREQKLLEEEKERLLAEETSATLIVIEAMKRAHRAELEQALQEACQVKSSSADADVAEILQNHSQELSAVQKELDALSEQFTQKCLETVHLTQVLQAEREVLQQSQSKIQALSTHNQELNNQLADEIVSRLSLMANGGTKGLIDGEHYELEIRLQVKESEVICLQQEIAILKTELYAAQMEQNNAANRYQMIELDLRLTKETAEEQIAQLKENLRLVNEALAESIEKTAPTTTLITSSHPFILKS